jgi:hypothetical protein
MVRHGRVPLGRAASPVGYLVRPSASAARPRRELCRPLESTARTGPTTGCTAPKPPEPLRPADLPSIDQARSLFHSLGVDVPVNGLHVTDGITLWFVSAEPDVGGLPTIDRTTSMTIGPKASVLAAHGNLGNPIKLGDYPLADAATVGFERLLEAAGHLEPRRRADRRHRGAGSPPTRGHPDIKSRRLPRGGRLQRVSTSDAHTHQVVTTSNEVHRRALGTRDQPNTARNPAAGGVS